MINKRIKLGKCHHWKKCPIYQKGNKVCNEEGGFYGSNEAGCSKKLNKIKEEKWKENEKKI